MALPSKTFQQYVSDMVAAWAASLGFTPTLEKGDALLAMMESVCSQAVFLQSQVQLVNAVARAQTSTGADLDSFYAQFDFFRLPGVTSSGAVTLSSFSPAVSQVLIPPGTAVQTVGGAIMYQVIGDTSQPTWSAETNAYILQPGQSSLMATVQALQPGSIYNVAANQLSQIATAIAGIDQVTNPGPISNGTDPEGDAAFRARFVLYINSLSKATYGAIVNAIQGTQQGVRFSLVENVNTANVSAPGEFVATVDDGSGSPPTSLIALVQAAVENTRGFTILGMVQAVTKESPAIVLTIRVAAGYTQSVVQGNAAQAVLAAVNAGPVGGVGGILVYISTVEGAALLVPGVVSVQPGTTIAGVAADYAGTPFQDAHITLSNITVGTY